MARVKVVFDESATGRLPRSVLDAFVAGWDGRYTCRRCGEPADARRVPTRIGAADEPGGVQLLVIHERCHREGAPPLVGGGHDLDGADGVSLGVAGFLRGSAPGAGLVWTVRGLPPAGGGDPVDRLVSTLLERGFSLEAADWARSAPAVAGGWHLHWDDASLALTGPDGHVFHEGPWSPPDGWARRAEADGAVVVLAASDLDLSGAVAALDDARRAGRLVAAVVAAHRRPEGP